MSYIKKVKKLIEILNSIDDNKGISGFEIRKIEQWIKENENNKDHRYQEIIGKLNQILKGNDTDNKIEVLKSKIKEKEIIGNELIDLIIGNEIIEEINKEAIKQLEILINNNCSVYSIDSESVLLSLILIGLLNYDSNFWDYVRQEYETLYSKFSEQKIEGQIRNVINKYKTDDDPRIISYVLKNAIVPKPFLPSFFDFIYDIYKLNFNYSIDPNSDLFDEFSFVYEGIKKGLNYETDDLNLNVTNKTYRLIKTTKELIQDDKKIKQLIDLSIKVLKIIDEYYWSINSSIENEYFKYGFENWRLKSEKSIRENKTKESIFRSRWEPEFKLKDNHIYLSIPNHKVKSCYDYGKLKIEIFSNNDKIYENLNLNVYDIIGGYRIEQNDDVIIEKPLDNIRYVLSCGDEIIYDSKEKMFRNYILFNESGVELKNNRDYNGIVLLCSNNEQDGFYKMYEFQNYMLLYKSVQIGDYVKINDEMFNFSTLMNLGIIGIEKPGLVVINKVEQKIYEEIEGIAYETEKNVENISIIINGNRHRLSEYEIDKKKRGLYNNYFIHLKLTNGKYEINIEELENKNYVNKKEFKFIIDKNFTFEIEPYKTNKYIEKISFLDKEYLKEIDYEEKDINTVTFDDKFISFIIPTNLQLYKIDKSKWYNINDVNNYIWINDISFVSNLRVNGIKFTSIQVKDENSNLLSTLYPSVSGFYYDVDIGSLKSYELHDYFYLDFYNEDKKIGLLKVYCKCVINEKATNFYFNKDDYKYYGNISFYGKGNVIVKVSDEKENIIYENQVYNDSEIEIDGLKPFVNYKLEIIHKKTGFTLEKDTVLYSKILKYYSFNDFVGRYFQIFSVDFDQFIMNKCVNKTRLLYNTYLEIIERTGDSNFIGRIYVHKGEKKYVDKVNPVEVEFASDPDSKGQMLTYITHDGEMLLNDFENHSILNDMDKKAIPIYSYIVNIERKKIV